MIVYLNLQLKCVIRFITHFSVKLLREPLPVSCQTNGFCNSHKDMNNYYNSNTNFTMVN